MPSAWASEAQSNRCKSSQLSCILKKERKKQLWGLWILEFQSRVTNYWSVFNSQLNPNGLPNILLQYCSAILKSWRMFSRAELNSFNPISGFDLPSKALLWSHLWEEILNFALDTSWYSWYRPILTFSLSLASSAEGEKEFQFSCDYGYIKTIFLSTDRL